MFSVSVLTGKSALAGMDFLSGSVVWLQMYLVGLWDEEGFPRPTPSPLIASIEYWRKTMRIARLSPSSLKPRCKDPEVVLLKWGRSLRIVPNLLDMNAAQLWEEIQRIDRKRGKLHQRQQGVVARQTTLVDRATANRQASAAAARATAERRRAAPPQAPARPGGGALPFSDVQRQRMSIGVGPMGAFIQM